MFINLLTLGEERERRREKKEREGFHANISLSCSLSLGLPSYWLCVMSHLFLVECRPSNKTGRASVRRETCVKSCPCNESRQDSIQFIFNTTIRYHQTHTKTHHNTKHLCVEPATLLVLNIKDKETDTVCAINIIISNQLKRCAFTIL